MEAQMADILVRDVAPNLKLDIENRAKAANRSLSDEIKHLLRVGIEREAAGAMATGRARNPAEAMLQAFADVRMSDAEHAEFEKVLEDSRRVYGRPQPDSE